MIMRAAMATLMGMTMWYEARLPATRTTRICSVA
jgi:hypothetical protein